MGGARRGQAGQVLTTRRKGTGALRGGVSTAVPRSWEHRDKGNMVSHEVPRVGTGPHWPRTP